MQILRPILRLLRHPNVATSPAPIHRFSCPSRPLLSLMACATPCWWPSAHAQRISAHMVFDNPSVRRVPRFLHEPCNMATISRVKDDESFKPYMGASGSSANVIIISEDNKHSADIQGMKNIDTNGTILEVIARDDRSDKDACRVTSEVKYVKRDTSGQIVKGEQRSAMENQRGEIVASVEKKVSDDEEYSVNNILAKSRHHDGSIYRGMDTWWKRVYLIADHNERSQEVTSVAVREESKEQPEVQEQEVSEADEEVGEDLPECADHRPSSFERTLFSLVADGQMYYGYCINCLYPALGES